MTEPVDRAGMAAGRSAPHSLAQHYAAASLLVLLGSLLVVGWWVGAQIQTGVVHRTAATTSLYVENFIVGQVQELHSGRWLTPQHVQTIESLLATTSLGREIVGIRVWGPGGRVVYGTQAGAVFPVKAEQARAWKGEVVAHVITPDDDENKILRTSAPRVIETYTPIRLADSDQVLAVAEFYQDARQLDQEVLRAQIRSWVVVALVIAVTYLLLFGVVRQGSRTIERQRTELGAHVEHLETLLRHNTELHDRVQRAASRTVAMNERFLRRVASDLHDGPAQEISHALLRLDSLGQHMQQRPALERDVLAVEQALTSALADMRLLARDLRLPDLDQLPVQEVVARAVRDHQRRSGTAVALHTDLGAGPGMGLDAPTSGPDGLPVSVKMAAFRIVQESLNNAYKHAQGRGQQVTLGCGPQQLILEIADLGEGLIWDGHSPAEQLGLAGMRERAESLGGHFEVVAREGGGTLIRARLPLQPEESDV